MAVMTLNNHIVKNAAGVPVIRGTRFKVIHLVMAVQAYGWSPEELHIQYPHLSMAQIHSALAYYWDHKEDLDADIASREEYANQMRERFRPHSIRPLLEKKGLI